MVKITRDFDLDLTAGSIAEATKAVGAAPVTGTAGLWRVPRKAIKTLDGFNVRADLPEYRQHIEELADSIATEGWYPDKPLACYVVREKDRNVIYAVEGHSRLAAFDIAITKNRELGDIPVVFTGKATSLEDLTAKLANANKSRPLQPYELAVIVHRLARYGWDEDRIAQRIGKTKRYVSDLLVLVGAPAAVRSMVVRGQVSATEAIAQVRKHGSEAVDVLKAAVEKAQAAGKAKATGKDIETPKRRPKTGRPDESGGRVWSDADFLNAAVHYALDVAGDTREWLLRWRAADDETLAELENYVGQPVGSVKDRSLRIAVSGDASTQAMLTEDDPRQRDLFIQDDEAPAAEAAAEPVIDSVPVLDPPAPPRRSRKTEKAKKAAARKPVSRKKPVARRAAESRDAAL